MQIKTIMSLKTKPESPDSLWTETCSYWTNTLQSLIDLFNPAGRVHAHIQVRIHDIVETCAADQISCVSRGQIPVQIYHPGGGRDPNIRQAAMVPWDAELISHPCPNVNSLID